VFFEGKRISQELAKDSLTIFWDIVGLAAKWSHHAHAKGKDIPVNQSLLDFVNDEDRITAMVRACADSGKLASCENGDVNPYLIKRLHQLVVAVSEIWGAYIGSSVDQQSMRYMWLEECLDGENLFCSGTYQKVLDEISAPALEGADIQLNCLVTRISSKSSGGTYDEMSPQMPENGQVTVQTSDGRTWTFDEVVMTAPLGWLKANMSIFEPTVPKDIQNAVDVLGYGMLDKVRLA